MGPCLSKKLQVDTESESSRNHRPRRETPPRPGDTPRPSDASRSASRAASEGARSRSTPREAHPGSGDLPRSVSGRASLISGDASGTASPEILPRTNHPPRSDSGGAGPSSRPREMGQRPHKGGSSEDTPRAASGRAGSSTGPRGTGKRSHESGSAINTSRSASRGASPRSDPGETSRKSHESASLHHSASSTSGGAGPGPDAGEMNQIQEELPLFESLPGPALERLMLQSRNLSLFGVSRRLNKEVSTERVYRTLILYALFNNDEKFPVQTSHFEPAQYEHLTAAERSALRRKVLECGWCTYSRIKKYLPDLMHLVLAREYTKRFGEGPALLPSGLPADLPADAINDFKTLTGFLQTDHPHIRADMICTSIRDGRPAFMFDYIPRKALDPGTWKNEATDYLLFIRQHLASDRLRLNVEFDTAAMTRGIETAIKEQNVNALYTLLSIEHLCCLRTRICNDNYHQLPSALPDSLFGLACRQGQHSKWILKLLFLATHNITPKNDSILRRWLDDHRGDWDTAWSVMRSGEGVFLGFHRTFSFERMLPLEFIGPYECPRMYMVSCFTQ